MTACYDLWDVETGNIVGTYETEEAALSVVRALVAANASGMPTRSTSAIRTRTANGGPLRPATIC